jgi:hypothetical protein
LVDRYESFKGTTCASGQEKYSPSLTQKIDVEFFVSNIGTYLQTTLPHIRDHNFIPANVRTSHLMHVISMTLYQEPWCCLKTLTLRIGPEDSIGFGNECCHSSTENNNNKKNG